MGFGVTILLFYMLQWLFEDKTRRVVYGQLPNLPIIVWVVSKIFLLVQWTAPAQALFEAIAFGALFTWAWLEIFDGVNWFRRILGVIVMAFLLSGATT